MRITRTRTLPGIEEPPARVRRVRTTPVEEVAPLRVRRVRVVPIDPLPAPSMVVNIPTKSLKEKRKAWEDSFNVHPKTIFVVDWEKPLAALFQVYMMASYLYYERDFSVLTDSDYDRICVLLGENYDKFEHQHKHLVSKSDFSATTGYAIRYPMVVKMAADYMQQHHHERRSA